MTTTRGVLPVRSPDGAELAGLLSALKAEQHPAIGHFATDRQSLEFLLDQCSIAVFDRFEENDDDIGAALLMVMDQGPEFVSAARLEPGGIFLQLTHTTLGDFVPYETPSRHPDRRISEPRSPSREPRAPDAADLNEFLRMFRAVNDPFLMDGFKNDTARLEYLQDQARIAIFDHCRTGGHEGSLAFFLWPTGLRYVMVAIRAGGRWRFASGEAGDI